MIARLLALLALALMTACSGGSGSATPTGTEDPDVAASAPLPDVTLPPGALVDQVLQPDEVPAGMVPIIKGSGPRSLAVVASYSGAGKAAKQAEARLRAHSFTGAYAAQYANLSTGQALSVLASSFGTPAAAAADFADDLKAAQGKNVAAPTLGEQSAVTLQALDTKPPSELVLVRFRRGSMTWSLAYRSPPPADAQVAIELARRLLARTSA